MNLQIAPCLGTWIDIAISNVIHGTATHNFTYPQVEKALECHSERRNEDCPLVQQESALFKHPLQKKRLAPGQLQPVTQTAL
jgi:hypothetical protein